jgi:hypothetical protein
VTVVFDSGIWISAMQFGGTPLEAVVEAISRDRIAVCDLLRLRVVRVRGRKKGLPQVRDARPII